MIWIYVLEADSTTGVCPTGSPNIPCQSCSCAILIRLCGRTNTIAEASYFQGIRGRKEGDAISGERGYDAQRNNQADVAAQHVEDGD